MKLSASCLTFPASERSSKELGTHLGQVLVSADSASGCPGLELAFVLQALAEASPYRWSVGVQVAQYSLPGDGALCVRSYQLSARWLMVTGGFAVMGMCEQNQASLGDGRALGPLRSFLCLCSFASAASTAGLLPWVRRPWSEASAELLSHHAQPWVAC